MVINIEQTGVKLVPTSEWTMEESGSTQVKNKFFFFVSFKTLYSKTFVNLPFHLDFFYFEFQITFFTM
jgi:hypothetical protein